MDEREELIQELDKSRGVLLELLAVIPPDIDFKPVFSDSDHIVKASRSHIVL